MNKKRAAGRLATLVLVLAGCCLPQLGAAAAYPTELVPVGRTVGIEFEMGGVMIVGFSELGSADGEVQPARDAGLREGDVISAFNGREINCAADFISEAAGMTGEPVELTVRRGEEELSCSVSPARGENGDYQLGVWLRDGLEGIGTLTYYDPQTGAFGALGHGVNDAGTESLVPLSKGSITRAEVVDVIKGTPGTPGELCGRITDELCGSIGLNTPGGIFGMLDAGAAGEAIPVAAESEICLGEAKLLANVEGESVREYEVEICRIYHGTGDGRCLLLSVTDPELLEETGGIVQGMSGSPIIQNGKLIGAVTHVLINDPTRGYGISAEKMLAAAGYEREEAA